MMFLLDKERINQLLPLYPTPKGGVRYNFDYFFHEMICFGSLNLEKTVNKKKWICPRQTHFFKK